MRNIAILIDGGYFEKRLPAVLGDKFVENDADFYVKQISRLIFNHLRAIASLPKNMKGDDLSKYVFSQLYRSFYYDAMPYLNKGHALISKKAIDYYQTAEARFHLNLFSQLRKMPSMALRLGEVKKGEWKIKPDALNQLLRGERSFNELIDEDFRVSFRQKAVDMRIGMDMTSMALKRQVDTVVLVTGDADFVPVAKLARREGVRVILDPLWRSVPDDLYEHIDDLRSGLPNPRSKTKESE